MVVGVFSAKATEAGVATIVEVMDIVVEIMMMVDIGVDMDGNFDGNGNVSLMDNRDVLLVDHGHFDGHLNGNGIGFLVHNRNGPVNGNVDGIGSWFLNHIGHGFLHMHWVGLGNVNGVGTVNGNLDGYSNLTLNGVWLWHWNLYLNWVWDVLDHFVGLGYGNFYRNWDVLLHGVGLRDQDFDGVGTVNGNMNWNWNFLLNWVGLGHMNGHLHVLLNMDGHMLDHFVGLRHGHFNGVGYMFLMNNWDVLLNDMRHWDTLQECYGLGNI